MSFVVDGVRHRGAEQVDSIVDTVTLLPGQAVSTGVAIDEGDHGPILSEAGEIEMQLAIRAPGPGEEVLSESFVVSVTEQNALDTTSAQVALFDAAATAVRDREVESVDEVTSRLQAIDAERRAWVVTATLPAAPLLNDVALQVARHLQHERTGDTCDSSADGDEALFDHILDGAAYDAVETGHTPQ